MPKHVDPDEKRAAFVVASWEIIAVEGLKGATLRRVAAEAGSTTGALTHYFADRRALLTAALRAAHYAAAARMLGASRRATSDSERLEWVLLEALPLDTTRLREWRVWLAFWAESMHDPDLARENSRRYAEWCQMLEHVIAPLVSDAAQAREAAWDLIAVVDGLGLRVAREASARKLRRTLQRDCRESLLRSLSKIVPS